MTMKELTIAAADENLEAVQSFVEEQLEAAGFGPRALFQVGVAVEEIFINIAHYAYAPGTGMASVRVEVSEDPVAAAVTFSDRGVPYDPLARPDPDVALPAGERPVGGLGVFLAKKLVDSAGYEYKDGQNVLTLKKLL